jgi:hypothetical protein
MSQVRQVALKPQDLVLALKLAVNSSRIFTFASLSEEVCMSTSEVHAASRRAQACRLLNPGASLQASKSALREFLSHGIQYVFPPVIGSLTRGMPTAHSSEVLSKHFSGEVELPVVWPHFEGGTRGLAYYPLYPSVPDACQKDPRLYAVLSLVDALRGGQARDREIAVGLLAEYLR